MKKTSKLTDKDLLGSQAALERAARSALTTARSTRTPCYVLKHGKIVDIAAARQRSLKRSASR
jgi:hypothetical protein